MNKHSIFSRLIQLGTVATVTIAAPLRADDSQDSKFRFGVGLLYCFPQSDLKAGAKAGWGRSLFVERDLNDGLFCRARAEYSFFGEDKDTYGSRSSADVLSVMAELGWAFPVPNTNVRPIKVFCGAGFLRPTLKASDPEGSASESPSGLGMSAGIEFRESKHWSMSFAYVKSIDMKYHGHDFNLCYWQSTLMWRF